MDVPHCTFLCIFFAGLSSVVRSHRDDSACSREKRLGPTPPSALLFSTTPKCSCEHIEGRFTAYCVARNMTEVPFGIPQKVISLRMDRNMLGSLTEPAYFRKRRLGNLLELYLKSCEITEVGEMTFMKLPILRILDLSHNHIHSLPDNGLSTLVQLRKISLAGNSIMDVKPPMFAGLVLVEEIDLSNNQVRFVYSEAFRGLIKLVTVRLDGNRLIRISPDVFSRLPTLQVVGLTQNLWICDCMMREFWQWERNRKVSEPPICDQPEHVSGKRWDQLQGEDLACLEQEDLTSDKKLITIPKGSTGKFSCPVLGDPKPEFSWTFRTSNHSSTQRLRESPRFKFTEGKKAMKFHVWISTISITNVGTEQEGIYTCSAKNKAGSTVEVFELNLKQALSTPDGADPIGEGINALQQSGDLWLVLVVVGTGVLVLVVLVVVVCCYRRGNGQRSGPVYSSVNGYGYQVIDGTRTVPEKPPRSHLEDYYINHPDALYELPPTSSDKQRLTVMFADDPVHEPLHHRQDHNPYMELPVNYGRTNFSIDDSADTNVPSVSGLGAGPSNYDPHAPSSSSVPSGSYHPHVTPDIGSPSTKCFSTTQTHPTQSANYLQPRANTNTIPRSRPPQRSKLGPGNGTLERGGTRSNKKQLVNGKAPLAQGEKEVDMKMPLRETAL